MIRMIVLATLLTLSTATTASAQVCASLDLTSQAQVDAVSCTSVTGDLRIHGADITNLDGLAAITSIRGSLLIYTNAALTHLDGLSALTSVRGYLSMHNNWALTNLDGLSALTSVGRFVSIGNNDLITNLDGLSALTSVRGGMNFTMHDALVDFCGIFPLLDGGGLVGRFEAYLNATNPTKANIIAAGPCSPQINAVQCYDVKKTKGSPKFHPQGVHLEDQFWQLDAIAIKAKRLCAPVDVDEELIANPEAHLTCYEIVEAGGAKGSKGSKAPRRGKGHKGSKRFSDWDLRDILVTNLYGEGQALTVKKPKSLCVPSTKEHADSGALPGDASELGIDHFLCYDVSLSEGEPGLDPLEVFLGDQFGEADRLLTKPKQLCTPVDKNSEGILDEETDLVCYGVKKIDFADPIVDLKLDVLVTNQFGYDQAYGVKKTKTVCLPSTQEVID